MAKVSRTVHKDGTISYTGTPGDTIDAAINDMLARHGGAEGLKALLDAIDPKGLPTLVCGTGRVTQILMGDES